MSRGHFARFDKVRLRDITAPMLQRWRNELVAGYSPAYARLVFGHFAMVLDFAVKLRLLQRNVARQVGSVRKVPKEVDSGRVNMAKYSKTAVKVNSTMSFGEFFRSYWVPDYRGRVRIRSAWRCRAGISLWCLTSP